MRNFSQIWKVRAVLAVLILTFAISEKEPEKLGDAYQIALPLIALGCSLTNGQAIDFTLRYVVQLGLVHGPKNALGDAQINHRPNGDLRGMPSGHTATAVLGASNIVHECFTGHPAAKAAVIVTAGFVGGSRIEAEAHNIWQVLAGVLVGWGVDRAFRRRSPLTWVRRFRSRLRR